jgi:hypothetical protein
MLISQHARCEQLRTPGQHQQGRDTQRMDGERQMYLHKAAGQPGGQSTRQVTADYCGQTVRGARSLDRPSRQPPRSVKKQRRSISGTNNTTRYLSIQTSPLAIKTSTSRVGSMWWALSHWIVSASENANCCTSTWSGPDGLPLGAAESV